MNLEPGKNKANLIKGQLFFNNRTLNFVISVRDGLSVFKCDSVSATQRIFKQNKKEWYKDDVELYNDGTPQKCIIRKYPGKTAGEISKELLIELKNQKVNVTKK